MSLTLSSAEAIRDLVAKDLALRDELSRVSSREEFTSTLATAAVASGIVVDAAALGQGLDIAFDHYSEGTELSDEQLDGITGGVGLLLVAGVGALLVATIALVGGVVIGFVGNRTAGS